MKRFLLSIVRLFVEHALQLEDCDPAQLTKRPALFVKEKCRSSKDFPLVYHTTNFYNSDHVQSL